MLDIHFYLFLISSFFLGISFGSFINNVGLRIVDKVNSEEIKNINIIEKIKLLKLGNTPHFSICPICNNKLKWWMNIPVFSWLFLMGKCGFCQTKIPFVYLLSELLFGMVFCLITYFIGYENFIKIIIFDILFILIYLHFLIVLNLRKN